MSSNASPSRRARARGFTLLEVLAALAVVGIALAATIKATGSYTANAAALRDQTIAQWVALNHIAELQLQPEWPARSTRRGVVEMAEREWHWTRRVKDTADQDLRRIEVDVRSDPDAERPAASVIAFVGRSL